MGTGFENGCWRSDFIHPYNDLIPARFWKCNIAHGEREKDMKWVVIKSCRTLNNDDSYNSRERLASLLDIFYSSLSGFKGVIKTYFSRHRAFKDRYFGKLNDLVDNWYGSNYCFSNLDYWKEGDENLTTDPSVAAFMETCVELLSEDYDLYSWAGVESGCSITREGSQAYSWHVRDKKRHKFILIPHPFVYSWREIQIVKTDIDKDT